MRFLLFFIFFTISFKASSFDFEKVDDAHSSIKDDYSVNSERMSYMASEFSKDGSRYAAHESVWDWADNKNNLIVISVWDTITAKLINKVVIKGERMTDPSKVNLKFSGNKDTLVIGMPAGLKNRVWHYTRSKKIQKSCESYMGSKIEEVSFDGSRFTAQSVSGNNLFCESNKESGFQEELFKYRVLPEIFSELGDYVRIEGIKDNKLRLVYRNEGDRKEIEKTVSSIEKNYPFMSLHRILKDDKK